MSAGHSHGPSVASLSAGGRYQHSLASAFALTLAFFVVELVTGWITNSLALLSDAGHMLTDVVGLGMALAAVTVAQRASGSQHSFGTYRLEILAALGNAVLLFGVAGWVLYEAVQRFRDPPEVVGIPVLVVATLGLLVNLVAFLLLRRGAEESINVRGAYLEVLADALGSVGVIIAAAVLVTTGWPYIDPIAAAGIGLFILPRTYRLAAEALRVLLQVAPPEIDLDDVRADLRALPSVVDVHDVHVWTLTSAMEVASAHLMIAADADAHRVLDDARTLLEGRYGLEHATLQVEPEDHTGCAELTW